MKPTSELTIQELLDLVENFEVQLLAVLKKELEKPDGPKLSYEHLELLGLTSDFAFDGKAEATETKKRLEKSITDIRKLTANLNYIPQSIKLRLSKFSKIDPRRECSAEETGITETEGKVPFLPILEAIKAEIEAELTRVQIERELIWKGSGDSFDARARYLAWKIAEIYYFLCKELPTISKNDGNPSSPYTRTVDKVFRMLGIEIEFDSPCRYVVNALKKVEKFPNPSARLAAINDPDFIAGTNTKK